ncbi:HRDC domain-containing protein [Deinococcus sp.]|uniref:HRDC domain-containing protein n=1 Tax=Deinococcus sp. TaxID=47478 RepID=UPI003CC5361D
MTTPLETLLARAHAQPGEPQTRLQDLLSALEESDWTLLLDGEDALAAQLADVLGPGLIRVDPRLSLTREVFAARGLALASSDGDWKGARAVWLLEPDERSLTRARRADVPVIVDATLSPGGRWTGQGAQYLVYRDAATLSGYGDLRLSALSGLGTAPRRAAPAAADLAVALALRDIGTLALRMNRRTRNAETLAPRFGGRALPVSGGVLLLEHDGPSTVTPLGGNLSAARAVPAGTLITVGIEAPDDAWAVLGLAFGGEGADEPARRDQVDGFQAAPLAVATPAEPSRPAQVSVSQPRSDHAQSEQPRSEQPPVPPLPSSPASHGMPADDQPIARASTLVDMTPGTMTPGTMTPGTMTPGTMTPGTMTLGTMTLGTMTLGTMTLGTPTDQGDASGDYSDREFVFTPPPVLPTPPSLPNQSSQPSQPSVVSQPALPAPPQRGRRGRRPGRAPEAAAPQEQPEIVMSGSFGRAPGADISSAEVLPQPDMQPDVWPEEAAEPTGQPQTVSRPATHPAEESVQAQQTSAQEAPLQLPPDLPEAAAADPASDLSDEQQAVYARLREWRNAEAKRQTVSRFIIASNATLAEVARRVPYTEADLKAVKGMGPERLRKYGEKILEVVRG